MIFLCLVRMYVHSMDSNVLWTMTLRRWRRASKTSKDIINTVTGLDDTTWRHGWDIFLIHLPSSCTFTLLHHSHGLPYMIPPYPYPYYTYTSTSYMNSLALTWSKYGPRRPPKGQSASPGCVHGSTFCRTPNRDQKRPLLWREHRHTSKIVTNMVVVSSTVTL